MAQRRVRDGGNSKAAIMRSAREVFAREGYHSAGVEKIAGKAGVAKGTVFLHFKSKEGLLVALIDDHFAACEKIYSEITPAGLSAREQLESIGMVENWSKAGVGDFGQVLMGIWGGLPAKVRKRLDSLMNRTYQLYLSRIAALFREMLGRSAVGGVSVEGLAAAYLAGLDGLMVRDRMIGKAKPAAADVGRALRFALVSNLCGQDAQKAKKAR